MRRNIGYELKKMIFEISGTIYLIEYKCPSVSGMFQHCQGVYQPMHVAAWVRIPVWACEKVASDLESAGGFRRVLRFPPLLKTGQSRISHNRHKCDEKRNSNSNSCGSQQSMNDIVYSLITHANVWGEKIIPGCDFLSHAWKYHFHAWKLFVLIMFPAAISHFMPFFTFLKAITKCMKFCFWRCITCVHHK